MSDAERPTIKISLDIASFYRRVLLLRNTITVNEIAFHAFTNERTAGKMAVRMAKLGLMDKHGRSSYIVRRPRDLMGLSHEDVGDMLAQAAGLRAAYAGYAFNVASGAIGPMVVAVLGCDDIGRVVSELRRASYRIGLPYIQERVYFVCLDRAAQAGLL